MQLIAYLFIAFNKNAFFIMKFVQCTGVFENLYLISKPHR